MFRKYLHTKKAIKIAGKLCYIKHIKFGKLPDFITQPYKNISILQKKQLMKKWGEEMRKEEIKPDDINYEDCINYVVENWEDFKNSKSKKGFIILEPLAIKMHFKGISFRDADFIKKRAQKVLNKGEDV